MMTLHKTNLFWAMLFLVSSLALADIKFYQSGLGRDWEILSAPKNRQGETEAIAQFFETYFPKVSEDREPQGQWKIRKSEIDKTHRHNNYHYYYKGRRVDGLGLGIHYNREGWIEYADSDLEKNISVEFEGDSPKLRARIAAQLQSQLIKNSGRDLKTLRSWKWEPILWRDEDHPEWLAAFQIEVTFDSPFEIKNLIVEQSSGAILSDYEKIRRVGGSRLTPPKANVYKNSIAQGLSGLVSIVTDDPLKLKNNLFHVMRDETVSNVTHRTEIVPANYFSEGFETESSLYNPTCVGIDSECANQAFDGVNVFYHLKEYRNWIDVYLNSLVATPQWADPLTVIINSQYVTIGNGKDNAFYFTGDCGYGIDRCLVFLKPSVEAISINNDAATTTSTLVTLTLAASGKSQMYVTDTSGCGGGGNWEPYGTSKAWTLGQINGTATVYVKYRNSALIETKCYSDTIIHGNTAARGRVTISGCDGPQVIHNLAREAMVVVHEYQHYVTDIISGIEFGTNAKPTVGDALHEGYSDYAAASALSVLNSPTDVTVLGVSFPACSGVRREIATLKVYEESSDSEDPHLSGLTWASALWKLRTRVVPSGADTVEKTVDKIALKSLYFLGANPGFVSSVESLVKADRALNNGANVASIRTLFYTEAKFLGSSESPFKDPNTLETFVGFKGCGGIELHRHREQSQFSGAVFLVWGLLSLFLGRFLSNRRVA